MDLHIAGRRAAVAAGSAGLGLGAAKALAAEGVGVAICGRDPDRLGAAVEAVRAVAAGSSDVIGIAADLSSADGASAFIGEAVDGLGGPVDILIANAGGPPAGTFSSTDLDAYRAAFELNTLSTVAMCQSAVPSMRERGWGRVVAISSLGARQPYPFLMASSVARAAVTSFLKILSLEVASDGVTVNNLQPGTHLTDRIRSTWGDATDDLGDSIPVGHLGDPDDFGAVAAFLCSTQANFITGVGLPVDGGANQALQ